MRFASTRRCITRMALAAGLAVAATAPGLAAEAVVLGDSIGEGLATTIGLRHIAKRSFSLRRGDVGAQLAQIPADKVGLMSLGLNDAADPVAQLAKSIEKVVQLATLEKKNLVWIGPPCVLKKWDSQAQALDTYLRGRLASTPIQYVSLRDERICSQALRAGDGEHFTFEGYKYVWEKIKRDAPLAAGIVLDPCEKRRAEALHRGLKSPDCARQAHSR